MNAESRKAIDLAEALRATHSSLPADRLHLLATRFNANDWALVATVAKHYSPPSQDAIDTVLGILKRNADRMNIDPFEGLT